MERFEDSPDLFGCGCGGSTDGEEEVMLLFG